MANLAPPHQGAHRQMLYMSRFACIGPDCESTCCHGWTIFLSKPEYKALKKTLGGSPEGVKTFRRNVTRFDGTLTVRPTNQLFAIVKMDPETHDCHFLREDRWCDLHAGPADAVAGFVVTALLRRRFRSGTRFFRQRAYLVVATAPRCP